MSCVKKFYVSTLAPGIAKYLNENNMTMTVLADKSGIPQSQLSNILNKRGVSGMRVKSAIKLMKATGLSFEELFMNEKEN